LSDTLRSHKKNKQTINNRIFLMSWINQYHQSGNPSWAEWITLSSWLLPWVHGCAVFPRSGRPAGVPRFPHSQIPESLGLTSRLERIRL